MKTLRLILMMSAGIVLFVYESCSPVMYSTVGQTVPMFTEKGEGMAQLGYALSTSSEGSTDASGVSLQGAYAVSNKVALIGSYYSLKGDDEQGSFLGSAPAELSVKGSYGELGGGLYGTTTSKKFAYELFGGVGFGSISNRYQNQSFDFNLVKPFVQPSFGYISRYVDVILTPRFGYLGYTAYSPANDPAMQEVVNRNNNELVFEPGVTLRAGVKNVKLQIQYNYSTFKPDAFIDLDGSTSSSFVANNEFVSIGLYILLSNRYKAAGGE